ncbi:HesA/MoeB/ThiF family protein [Ralstonia pseudosolanacearum]|uniref:HesA/MoeB/ThiF family protein n=1 Tax=Ralstonia pseudosolanacearum TaxID=1310165 RepID=UPI0008F86B06|nr:ThiF family adenylyltransferase [Ralstonia pseudosolanacearum]AXW34213.1 molybdopterin biosynthesis protein MoeB [Ralstonia solanacearum]MCK4165243.1 ThiF family adenylyltransferase [Ralstonia pseudosolanacearum]NKA61027.1 molybdopterin biosynthesis protein MoeB [Ralstonia solanacearum]NKA91320.1 molybdopterin biosynthesis protein MoeB [Ralstonia solanacearum]NKB15424.1 molybdopterin biosynthesis protein MoeB [Ralstonia solanacearum]
MDAPRICLLGSQATELAAYLDSHPNGHERAAVVMFRRFRSKLAELPSSDRFVAVEITPFHEHWLTGSSAIHFEYSLRVLRPFFQRCEDEGLVFGLVHNHPHGYHDFSGQDDENERVLLQAIANRNGKDCHLVAIVRCDGQWHARVRYGQTPDQAVSVRHIAVLGDRVELHDVPRTGNLAEEEDTWARQAAAFGRPFVDKLRSLRIGVVGCSGTGSPAATVLARAGIGELVVIDQDPLARSNLNRVRGAGKNDIGRNKAEIARDFIRGLDLDVHVTAINALVDISPEAIDALATCDVVFGCTDDDLGRLALNAAVSYYGLAYIDLGLGGNIARGQNGMPRITHQFGRVSLILPEFGACLYCQRVTSDQDGNRQQAIRDNPQITEEELAERYLPGGREQAPGVGPFTSAIADFGVATLFDLIQPYMRLSSELRRDIVHIDFVRMTTASPMPVEDQNCVYCGTREHKLKLTPYRLGRPQLGKISKDV